MCRVAGASLHAITSSVVMVLATERMSQMSTRVLLCTLFSGIASTAEITLSGLAATYTLEILITIMKL